MSLRLIGPATGARKFAAVTLALVVAVCSAHFASAAEPTTRQRRQVRAAENKLKRAGNLYRAKNYRAVAELVEEVQQALVDVVGDEEDTEALSELIAPVQKRVTRARQLLQEQGIEIAPPATKSAMAGNDGVSFTRQVAPLLVAKCGNCHVRRSRGQLSMATFAALEKGSEAGAVIASGDADGSRLIEVIAAGDMPRGGGKITPEELKLLSTWINEGARFDGDDPATPLVDMAGSAAEPADNRLSLIMAREDDTVKFGRDLGEVLIKNCLGCHGDQNPRGGFSVNTFSRLLRGGDNGAVLVPGKPEDSLLVKKLRGTADGERMPMGRPALADETIAAIETWIALGARFDGPDPAATLVDTVDFVTAMLATHEQLSASRAERAATNWRLIMPDVSANTTETEHVLVYGSVGDELLAEVTQVADEQVAELAQQFGVPAEQPLIKGRLTLYVFDKRYDYGEVGIMLEEREIPADWRGHWRFTGVDAYGCILLGDDTVPRGLIAQQIAGAYAAGLGQVPRWFAEGTARAMAATLEPREDRVGAWNVEARRIVESLEDPTAFLRNELSPEETDVLSYAFVKDLTTPAKRYQGFLAALRSGEAFDTAFEAAYRADPEEAAKRWAAGIAKRRR